jgi:Domain of unknown function (DUF4436)
MRIVRTILNVLTVALFVGCYFTVVWLGFTEEPRRSLSIEEQPANKDSVVIEIRVIAVDTGSGLLTTRIRLIPMGRFAIDSSTPAVNLKLLLNSVSGSQVITFEKGVRIVPIECTTLLTGNTNKYPLDRYSTNLDLLLTTPSRAPSASSPFDQVDSIPGSTMTDALVVGTSDLSHNETVPIEESVVASIPGIKFSGKVNRDSGPTLTHTNFTMRRANNVIAVSVVVMITMLGLAITIMGMVLRVTASPGEVNLLPLSLCIALIFGLPALRSVQPSVPGVGVLGDYLAFTWAELMVSVSAIALGWTWIVRAGRQNRGTLSHVKAPEQKYSKKGLRQNGRAVTDTNP